MGSVVAIPAWALTTLPMAKTFLGFSVNDEDGVLALLIRDATLRVEGHTKRKLKSRAYASGTPDTRLVHDGRGDNRLMTREYPCTTLSAAHYVEANASGITETALSIVGAYIAPGSIIVLQRDVFPSGTGNIRVAATCGYLAGTHDSELAALEGAVLRVLQVKWQQHKNQIGMVSSVREAGGSVTTFEPGDMPQDVVEALEPFVRRY